MVVRTRKKNLFVINFPACYPDLYFLDIYKVSILSYSLLRPLYNGETETSHDSKQNSNSRAPRYIYGVVEELKRSVLFVY